MSSSNQTANIATTDYKLCSRCSRCKTLREFVRFYRGNEKEMSTCNDCSEKKNGKRPEPDTAHEFSNQPEYYADGAVNLEEIRNDEDDVSYKLAELEELVTIHFANIENEEVNFS